MHTDVIAALLLVWAGLVAGVSFLATPAKFRSRQLSRPVALDVGRCTFAVLGRVELAFAVAIAAAAALSPLLSPGERLAVQIPAAFVLAQFLWLRPRLDRRTRRIIDGADLPPSPLHVAFIGSETLKLCSLLALAALIR
jgi:hypothetical protein